LDAAHADGVRRGFTYKASGQLGAGQLATVDGPLTNDVIGYAYDELGRVTTRTINGLANSVTWSFDALGRLTGEANVLGTFTYAYDGVTSRLITVTYPNGQTSTYSYLSTTQDHRLQTIHHKYPGGATLSKFDYTYDVVGNIMTWQQQADGDPAVLWTYGHDAVDQLTSAIKQSTGGTPSLVKRHGYGYDPAGNRTFERNDDQVMAGTHGTLNRLLAHVPGGPLQFVGTLSEPATISIQGAPAAVDATNTFRGSASLTGGQQTVSVVATDPSGNQATRQYQVDIVGAAKTFTYDENGNLTSDGSKTLEWDARNQLIAVSNGTKRREFVYDGLRRRIRAIEKEDGVIRSDVRIVWCGSSICEYRSADGLTVERRIFADGEQVAGAARFMTRDHVGSPTEVVSASALLLARYSFSPWGERTLVVGSDETIAGFAGQEWDGPSGLSLTRYRAYLPEAGRWISEDPLGLEGGLNLYGYASAEPIGRADPTGLVDFNVTGPHITEGPRSKIGGCGKTTTNLKIHGDCTCQPDGWQASLTLHVRGDIEVANDTWITPRSYILSHELRHWEAKKAMAELAKVAGDKLEGKVFGSEDECKDAIHEWRKEWIPKIRDASAHSFAGSLWKALQCR
jgi:RHS repeat-associated protein